MRRFLWFAIALPIGLLLVTIALANRHAVQMVLDPFRPANPVVSLVLPFYVYLIVALLAGVVLGGAATWRAQARWRRNARRSATEAQRWHAEADRLGRERERSHDTQRQLLPANR